MQTVRMTTAQALVKFLNQQYVEFDGKQQKFIKESLRFWSWKCSRPRSSFRRGCRRIRSISREKRTRDGNAAMAFAKQNIENKLWHVLLQ